MLYDLLSRGKRVRMLYCDFKKRPSLAEIGMVKYFSLLNSVPYDTVDVRGLAELPVGFVEPVRLFDEELDIDIPDIPASGQNRPITYGRADGLSVTGFHTILSIGTYAAQMLGATEVAIAVTKEQADRLPTLDDALSAWSTCAEAFNPNAGRVEVLRPLIGSTKAEIVQKGVGLSVPLEHTWSCTLSDNLVHDGTCRQCMRRRDAFKAAGVADPTNYAS